MQTIAQDKYLSWRCMTGRGYHLIHAKLLKTTSRVYSWSDPIIGQQADERSEIFSRNFSPLTKIPANIRVHYSFDYAQQPIFFLTPRKCLGVSHPSSSELPRRRSSKHCDQQASLLFGNADNCTGQNKNSCMPPSHSCHTKFGLLKQENEDWGHCTNLRVQQLVDGTTVVPIFDWTSFFAPRMKETSLRFGKTRRGRRVQI